MKIDIIGGGIGGLTLAIALEQKGITPTIYEQAEHIKPVGAGIILANNAMQVYENLGLRKEIEAHGQPITSLLLTEPNLKPLSKLDLTYFETKYKVKTIAIHRAVLQRLLIDKLTSTQLHLNHKLKHVTKNESGHLLEFENGKLIQSETLIAADGIHSVVRENLFKPNTIRHANQVCWRGISNYDLPEQHTTELNEIWGNNGRFGFVQIAKNKVYWYALKSYKLNSKELSVNKLEHYFSSYHPIVNSIIKSTSKEHINTAEISDLKPISTWYHQNVCLMGDAAHALTPNMGQGACQAIEDAYILAQCLNQYQGQKAFESFQKLRLSKAHLVVNTSWTVGKMAHISNPILIKIRNQLMKLIPAKLNRKQTRKIFKLAELPLSN